MDAPKALLTLSLLAAALAPQVARADHDERFRGGIEVHVHGPNCQHGPPPGGAPSRHGRYEIRTVQKWVEGYYEQVWVPQRCRPRHHGHWMRCRGGHYEQVWRPGQYVTTQEWVWVPQGGGWRHGHREHAAGAYPGTAAGWGSGGYSQGQPPPAGSPVVHFQVNGQL